MVFLPKTLLSFFEVDEKLETRRNLNLTNFRRLYWRLYKCKIYIETINALGYKPLCIFYKRYPLKRIFLCERGLQPARTFNCSSRT